MQRLCLLMVVAACSTGPAPARTATPAPAAPAATLAGGRQVGWRVVEVADPTRRVRPGFDGVPAGAVRTLPVQIWYPASSGGQAATYRDYAGSDPGALQGLLSALGAPPDSADKLLAAPRPARRGARAASGRAPLAIWVGGENGPLVAAPLAEQLASRGWAVASFPGWGRHAHVQLTESDGEKLETRVRDLEVIAAALGREPDIDARRPALIAFSGEAPAALVYALRNPAAAVVSLDGWDARALGASPLSRTADADPAQLRAPYLAIQSRDGTGERDLTFVARARHSSRIAVSLALGHFDLLAVRHAAGAAPAEAAAPYAAATSLMVGFLDHARGGPAPTLPDGAQRWAAEPAAPDHVDVARALFERKDAAAAVRMLSELKMEETELNELGYRLLRAGHTAQAVEIFSHATVAYPKSANTFDSLGEALLAAGDRKGAVAAYQAALAIDPGYPSAVAALDKLGVKVASTAATRPPPIYRLIVRPPARRVRVTSAELRPGQVIEVHHGPRGGPVVVFLNGVGTSIRSWDGYRVWAALVAAAGMNAVLYDGATVEDAEAALAYLDKNAAALRIDPQRLCIFASSANGRVGVRLPQRASAARLDCAVYYYPVLDVPAVRPDLPVLLVRTGIDAPMILATIDAWVDAAVDANARVEVLNLPRHQHGFDARDDNHESRRVIRETIEFFARHLLAAKK
jgi:dienelactone hydrolase